MLQILHGCHAIDSAALLKSLYLLCQDMSKSSLWMDVHLDRHLRGCPS